MIFVSIFTREKSKLIQKSVFGRTYGSLRYFAYKLFYKIIVTILDNSARNRITLIFSLLYTMCVISFFLYTYYRSVVFISD